MLLHWAARPHFETCIGAQRATRHIHSKHTQYVCTSDSTSSTHPHTMYIHPCRGFLGQKWQYAHTQHHIRTWKPARFDYAARSSVLIVTGSRFICGIEILHFCTSSRALSPLCGVCAFVVHFLRQTCNGNVLDETKSYMLWFGFGFGEAVCADHDTAVGHIVAGFARIVLERLRAYTFSNNN